MQAEMFPRLRNRCGRVSERVLWMACCVACFVCFIFVFLSLYYLEDHRERLACQKTKESAENYETLLKSYPVELLWNKDKGSIQDLIVENFELRRTIKRLSTVTSERLIDSGRGGSLTREYIQDIKDENVELKRTVKELRRSFQSFPEQPVGIARSWRERSLKYVSRESSRVEQRNEKDYTSEVPSLQETSGLLLSCREISKIKIQEELGRGYTKLTQRGVYNGRDVAVKSVGLDSTDVHKCVEEKRAKKPTDCLLFSRYKVMKELLLYQQLNHPNVIKLLGYCFQNDQDTTDIQSRGLTVVTEIGTPLNLMTVLQMAWHQRFRIAVGLARLVKYFSNSPLGSLVIRDFQLIQFVTINGEVNLSDLDDIGNEEHSCRLSQDCVIGNATYNITLPCVDHICQGYNERWNLYNLDRFYFKMFLIPGAPEHVVEDLQRIGDESAMLRYPDSGSLVRDMENVLGKLRSGQGLETDKYRPRHQYKTIPHADFPGCHDYECDHSISLVNCQSLAFDKMEALRQCDEDEQCRAFVISYDKTWIGYKWVYFKNNSTNMVFSAENRVYVKIT